MSKFVKVMYGTVSGAKSDFEYKINEVNVANNWNPTAKNAEDFGGFNYTTDDSILRWLHRGDTIYDVEVPNNAEIIKLDGATTIYRTNKIIINNPRKIDDDLALYYYKISNIPEKSYYKALGVVSIMNYKKTAYKILKDKVGINNIDEVLKEWNDFIFSNDEKELKGLVKDVNEALYEIKSDLLVSINVSKDVYTKNITNDKVINITGESGSGKSYYTNKYLDDDNYIVIDTDLVFNKQITKNMYILELREIFKNEKNDFLITNFDDCYKKILDYFKSTKKTIVIDCAQFRNIKDYSILKGKIIIMRTSVNTCYERCINRWKNQNSNYTKEELEKYQNKKLGMYIWYKSFNEFIKKVDSL